MKKIDQKPIEPIVLQVGAAIQDSQQLELSISLIITMLIDLSEGRLSDADFVGWMDRLGSKTLGRLIHTIKEHVDFDDTSETILKEALKSRNYIVHDFFNERSETFLTPVGRKEVLSELGKRRKQIRRAYEMIDPIVAKLFELKGIDMNQIIKDIHAEYEPT